MSIHPSQRQPGISSQRFHQQPVAKGNYSVLLAACGGYLFYIDVSFALLPMVAKQN
jgi:hypothetical protein